MTSTTASLPTRFTRQRRFRTRRALTAEKANLKPWRRRWILIGGDKKNTSMISITKKNWDAVTRASEQEAARPELQEHVVVPINSDAQRPVIVQARMTHVSFAGWLGYMTLVCMITIASVSAAVTSFILYIRPALKTFEETCKATEKASKQLEIAAIEMEEAAITFDEILPPSLKSVEHASREFEELGQALNSLSGGLLSRRPSRHRRREKESESEKISPPEAKTETEKSVQEKDVQRTRSTEPSQNITRQTMRGINKAAADITNFTHNFKPAMNFWRKQLSSIVYAVEDTRQSRNASQPKQLEEGNGKETIVNGANNTEVISESPTTPIENGAAVEDSVTENNDDREFEHVRDIHVEDLFKDKDSLFAKLTTETEGDTASEIISALYKAEQAADDAARASGDLQEAVERAQNLGDWEDFVVWGDEETPLTSTDDFPVQNFAASIYEDETSALKSELAKEDNRENNRSD